jgi:hypothetical protein
METKSYKLGEHKISEDYGGELRWEAHFGFGALREGRCYKKGSILFFGPVEAHRDGFLKSEFIDHLKAFPDWLKTKYYCNNPDIYNCQTGERVSREEMRLWVLDRDIDKEGGGYINGPIDHRYNIETDISDGDFAFKLQRFKIVKKRDGKILWETYGGAGRIKIGECKIVEDIIFIGPQQKEKIGLGRRQFIADLCLLAEWNQTKYYCPRHSLRDCRNIFKTEENRKKLYGRWISAIKSSDIRNKYKKPAESKSAGEPRSRIFSAGLSPIFDGIGKQIETYKSFFSKKLAAFCTPRFKKCKTHITALIRSMIFPLLSLLVGYLKELYKRLRDRKYRHSSSR